MTQLPKSIFDLLELEDFRLRTAMYLGEKKICVLRAFIDGYFYATDTHNLKLIDDKRFLKFNDWTALHFGWRESTAGWKNIILDECNRDEEKAVDKFFEVYDKFIADTKTP
ncbi:MAG TPA: hypothetical protein PLP23_01765 [Panacibacter sp.]|nr:hypothetical protein [Panacibacter sp.]